MIRIRSILMCFFVLAALMSFSQNNQLIITGKFRVDGGSNNGAQIILEKDGRKVKTIEGEARFELGLDFQAIYIVSFVKEGFVTKKLRFDTHVSEERIEYGFEPFEFIIEIFEQFDDVSVVVFNQPVGKISYSDLIDEFDYDTDYTKSIQTQIAEVMEQVEEKKEEKEQQVLAQQKEEAAKDKQVSSLTTEADKSLVADKPEEALKKLEEASKIKDSPEIQKKIEEVKEKIVQKEKDTQKKNEFEAVLAEANTAMAEGDLLGAKRLYEQANGVIEGDAKVKDKLAQIDKQIAENAKAEENFKNLESEVKAANETGDLPLAIAKAEEALKIKPDQALEKLKSEMQSQLEQEKAAMAAQAELEKEFGRLMAEATKQRDAKNLKEAIATLESANALFPSPEAQALITELKAEQKQIEEAEKAEEGRKVQLASLLDQAESALTSGDLTTAKLKAAEANKIEANSAKEVLDRIDKAEKEIADAEAAKASLEAEYDEFVRKAKEALTAGEFEESIKGFQNALALKPDGTAAIQGLAEVEEKKREIEIAKAEKEKAEIEKKEQFEELLAKAEASLANGDLEGAKSAFTAAGELFEDKRIEKGLTAVEDAIEEKLKAESSAAETQKRFEDAMKLGDDALAAGELEEALKAYESANKISESPLVIAKLEEIHAKMKELEALTQAEENKAREDELARKQAEEAEKLKVEAEELARKQEEQERADKAKEEERLLKEAEAAEAERKKQEELLRKESEVAEAERLKAEEKEREEKAKEEERLLKEAEAAEAERKKLEELSSKELEAAEAERLKAEEKERAEKAKEEERLLKEAEAAAAEAEKKRLEELTSKESELAEAERLEAEEAARKEAEEAKRAAQAIANGPRESNELKDIINQESEKQKSNKPVLPAKKPIENKERLESKPSTIVPGGAVVISENRVGKAALDSPAAVMTEDDAYDGMMRKVEEQAFEMEAEQEQRVLKEKYPLRKTIETEKAGTSVITYVYINRGDFVNVYKKVEHNWGGVFYFIDERATNQRFWEHETQ